MRCYHHKTPIRVLFPILIITNMKQPSLVSIFIALDILFFLSNAILIKANARQTRLLIDFVDNKKKNKMTKGKNNPRKDET